MKSKSKNKKSKGKPRAGAGSKGNNKNITAPKPPQHKAATLNIIADVLMIEPRWVNQLVKKGIMHRLARGKYDLKACVQDYIRYLKNQVDEARRGGMTESQARTQLYKTQEELKRIELAQAYGEVINLTDAKKAIEDILKATRDKLLGIPRRVAPEIVAVESVTEAEQLLEKRIDECLYESTTIPNSFNRLAKVLQRNNSAVLDDIEPAAKIKNQRVGRSVSHTQPGK